MCVCVMHIYAAFAECANIYVYVCVCAYVFRVATTPPECIYMCYMCVRAIHIHAGFA